LAALIGELVAALLVWRDVSRGDAIGLSGYVV